LAQDWLYHCRADQAELVYAETTLFPLNSFPFFKALQLTIKHESSEFNVVWQHLQFHSFSIFRPIRNVHSQYFLSKNYKSDIIQHFYVSSFFKIKADVQN